MRQGMDLKRCKLEEGFRTTKVEKEREGIILHRHHQNYAAKTENVSLCWLLELPIHILYDIFSSLPMKTIFSCRCVCKMFLKVLVDPYFAELHLTRRAGMDHCAIVQNTDYASDFSLAYVCDLGKQSSSTSWNIDYCSNPLPWRTLTRPTIISESGNRIRVSLCNSCNGLLCLSYYTGALTIFYVCNPIRGEFMPLPQCNNMDYQVGALGYTSNTKQYKVICFVARTYSEIHTLGTNEWRTIEDAPYPYNTASFDSSLSGNLHWITDNSDISKIMCSLNLETEQFHYISPPPHFDSDFINRVSCKRTGVLGGLFSFFYLLDEAQLEVYLRKEYGVKSSWTRQFTVNLWFNFLSQSAFIIPMKLLNNGDILIRYSCRHLVYYSPQKGILREIKAPGDYDVIVHVPSFISLKDIVGDINVEVVRRNEPVFEMEKRYGFESNCSFTNREYLRANPVGMVGQGRSNLFSQSVEFDNLAGRGVAHGGLLGMSQGRRRASEPIRLFWQPDEDDRLVEAVGNNRNNNGRISWSSVAKAVGTRTDYQCEARWRYWRSLRIVA